MKKSIFLVLCLFSLSGWGADCTFDTDAADSPGFTNKMNDCNTLREQRKELDAQPDQPEGPAIMLYGEGTAHPVSGISERPVVTPGTLNHSAGQEYAARERYSLRPTAKFEDSVTFAIHKLHVQMAHFCAKGWSMEKEWTEPDPLQEGDFYLHYRFRCSENS